jgi:hypothetical protein
MFLKQKRIFSPAPLAKGLFCICRKWFVKPLPIRQKTANFQKDTPAHIYAGRFLTLGLFFNVFGGVTHSRVNDQ